MGETLTKILNAMAFLRRFELFLVESLKYDGVIFSAEGKVLRGDNLLHSSGSMNPERPVKTGEVVGFESTIFVTALDPVVRVQSSGSGEQHSYLLVDKVVGANAHYTTIPAKY
jgi:hypothetical protein